MSVFTSIEETRSALDAADYLVDDGMSMALFLAVKLRQPLLLDLRRILHRLLVAQTFRVQALDAEHVIGHRHIATPH